MHSILYEGMHMDEIKKTFYKGIVLSSLFIFTFWGIWGQYFFNLYSLFSHSGEYWVNKGKKKIILNYTGESITKKNTRDFYSIEKCSIARHIIARIATAQKLPGYRDHFFLQSFCKEG